MVRAACTYVKQLMVVGFTQTVVVSESAAVHSDYEYPPLP